MNRSIPFACLITLVVAIGLSCQTSSPKSTPNSTTRQVRLAEGDYLSTDYMEALTVTRSPLEAEHLHDVGLVQLRYEADRVRLEPIFNFHEGGEDVVLNQDGSPVSGGAGLPKLTFSILDEHTLRLGYAPSQPANYVFVKDVQAYVSKIALVGSYVDQHGRSCRFGEDGWAEFPDRKFQFEIGLDHVLDHFDYFMDAGHDKKNSPLRLWAFKWNHKKLEIFRTKSLDDGGVDEIADPHPVLTLTPVP